jgi:hypothetical protein
LRRSATWWILADVDRPKAGTGFRELVLLVGGDDATAQHCARAAAPLPVLRAKQVGTATERLRAMRPRALVLASDLPEAAADALAKIASEQAAPVVRLAPGLSVGELRQRLG